MLELGDYSEELHTKLGDVVVNNNVDILVTVGEWSLNIEKRAIELGMDSNNCYHFVKESDCYDLVCGMLDSGDIVLLKGSHGIHLNKVVDKIMEY